jgi:hypothetical protein
MAKKGKQKETKSDFLRRVLSKNPNLDYRQVNQKWAKGGHEGRISEPLYYLVRKELGIRSVWMWVHESQLPKNEVYQLKVTLQDSHPPIWRRIQVRDCTLGDFHVILQIVMGWQESHLHQFIVNGEYYGRVIQGVDMGMDIKDEEDMLLNRIVGSGGKVKFFYEYDFGDSWVHEITLEETLAPESRVAYPRCLEGARACPPEDVGGVWGYADFLQAIANPEHESHDDMLEWIGGKFDPKAFSVHQVNRTLRQYF